MAQEQTESRGRFPLDDLAYDLVTVLHQKSKGLEAYDKYLRDAERDPEALKILEQIRRQDTQVIEQLKACVARTLGATTKS